MFDFVYSMWYIVYAVRKDVKNSIIDLLEKKEYMPADLQKKLQVSRQIIHRYLHELCAGGYVEKMGKTPQVYYRLVRRPSAIIKSHLIDSHFMFKDSVGNVYSGVEGFLLWSKKNLKKYSLEEKVRLYEQYVQEFKDLQKKDIVFSLKGKLGDFHKQTGEEVYLQDVVCAVPYAFPDFGKTKESILLSIAKDGSRQGKVFCEQLVSHFLPVLLTYLKSGEFDAVVFVPPSAPRPFQLMRMLQKRFSGIFDIPIITVGKKHGDVPQQQKHLSNINDRIENADRSFFVRPVDQAYNKVLLVDDFIGSGATMNQIAKKMVRQGVAKKVWGIGIVGVRKGFKVVKKV